MDIWNLLAADMRFNDLIAQVKHVSHCIRMNGWAEANAGNLSINISSLLDPLPECRGKYWFLVSRTGSRYRDLACDPVNGLMVAAVNGSPSGSLSSRDQSSEQDHFQPFGSKPTSEWVTHRALHHRLIELGLEGQVVLHAHPNPIILLSSLPEYGKALDATLIDLLPEVNIFLPNGIGYVPVCPPGSPELADHTLRLMDSHQVIIWQKHGILAIAPDLASALDTLEVTVKAAELYLYLRKS
ncbi:MAG: class II aldolase/adducin family protein [Candidatus Cloacimonetes bacterium]|nr:class II aldolase/adducin family protein [Candidatus Cloacimonadota bacterium]